MFLFSISNVEFVVCFLSDWHSDWGKTWSQCGFDLHLSGGWCGWRFFYMLIGYLDFTLFKLFTYWSGCIVDLYCLVFWVLCILDINPLSDTHVIKICSYSKVFPPHLILSFAVQKTFSFFFQVLFVNCWHYLLSD